MLSGTSAGLASLLFITNTVTWLQEFTTLIYFLILIDLSEPFLYPLINQNTETLQRHFTDSFWTYQTPKNKIYNSHRQTIETQTTPPTSSLSISGMYHVSHGLKGVILRWWIDGCVLLRVWFLCFRVRWPASAGHAEPHGEEEAGLHPRAHRHGGELRQRPSARHRGEHKHTRSWYLFQ